MHIKYITIEEARATKDKVLEEEEEEEEEEEKEEKEEEEGIRREGPVTKDYQLTKNMSRINISNTKILC